MSEIHNVQNIETWFMEQGESDFPKINLNNGEKTYPEKYELLKSVLMPYHNNVESGALLESIEEWRRELKQEIDALNQEPDCDKKDRIKELERLLDTDPIIYLNQHGVGHVEKVIEKVTELINNFRFDVPTPSETFILLCAIQIHDIGNIFGRDNHEQSFQAKFRDIAKNIITDTVTQKFILKIAQVHSGNINGNKDTISNAKLRMDAKWFNQSIREPVLASLLRFADELADDSSRYDRIGDELGKIPQKSLIYHAYSKTLHAVNICENDLNKTCYVSLEYYLDSDTVVEEYKKNESSILLIDEIFARTKKMEQERRYCMRFLSAFLPLTEIRVRIEIDSEFDLIDPVIITYSLKENGYPNDDIIIDCKENEGYKVIELLKRNGWRLEG